MAVAMPVALTVPMLPMLHGHRACDAPLAHPAVLMLVLF